MDIGADKLALCREKLSVNRVMSFRITRMGKEIQIDQMNQRTPTGDMRYWIPAGISQKALKQ